MIKGKGRVTSGERSCYSSIWRGWGAECREAPLGGTSGVTRLNVRVFFISEDSQTEKGLPDDESN